MNDTLLEAIKEAYASAPANQYIIETLEIKQDGIQTTIYIAQSRVEVQAYDENAVLRTFEPVGFAFTLPPVTEEGFPSLNIAIDNVNRRVTTFIETAKSAKKEVEIIYRPYVSTDLSTPQMDPPITFYLRDVNLNPHQVTGRAVFTDLVNKKFPSEIYTRARFPTL